MAWQFTRWTGSAETAALNATRWNGTTEEALTEASTTVVGFGGTTGARFKGDPGEGKILLGWDTSGSNWPEHYRETARLRSASAGGSYPANSSIAEGVYRAFVSFGQEVWGNHGTAQDNWTECRHAAANVGRVFVNYEMESGTSAKQLASQGASGATYASSWGSGTGDKMTTFLNTNNYEGWLDNLAIKLADIRDRYGAWVWVSLCNEPDAFGNSKYAHVYDRLTMNRRCMRKFYRELVIDRGVTNLEVTTPTTFVEIARQHVQRHTFIANNIGTLAGDTRGAGVGAGRFDALYTYHPDWKGTITTSGGWWTDAFDPNPADFYTAGQTDPDGYVTGPILNLAACNSYAHAMTISDGSALPATLAALKLIVPNNTTFSGNQERFYTALYGRTFPWVVGEHGYPIWQVGTNGQPSDTADYWSNEWIASAIDSGWIGASVWIQNTDGTADQQNVPNWLPIGGKFNPNHVGSGCLNDDPRFPGVAVGSQNDTKRKALAAMWSNPNVVLPSPWPDGTPRPLSPQHQ